MVVQGPTPTKITTVIRFSQTRPTYLGVRTFNLEVLPDQEPIRGRWGIGGNPGHELQRDIMCKVNMILWHDESKSNKLSQFLKDGFDKSSSNNDNMVTEEVNGKPWWQFWKSGEISDSKHTIWRRQTFNLRIASLAATKIKMHATKVAERVPEDGVTQ